MAHLLIRYGGSSKLLPLIIESAIEKRLAFFRKQECGRSCTMNVEELGKEEGAKSLKTVLERREHWLGKHGLSKYTWSKQVLKTQL